MSLKQYSIVQPTWSSLAQIFWQWRSLMALQPWLDEDELWPPSLTPRTEPFYQVPLRLTPTYSKKPYIKFLKGANPLRLKDFLRINHPPSSHLPTKRTLLLWLFSLITKTKQLRILQVIPCCTNISFLPPENIFHCIYEESILAVTEHHVHAKTSQAQLRKPSPW